jgi:glycine cleavage system H protein
MKVDRYEYPRDLYYDQHHSYARLEDDLVVQGITDLAQGMLDEILYVELPYIGRKVQQGERLLSVQPMHELMRARRIHATVSGQVVAVNQMSADEPDTINQDPYGTGWLVKIKPADLTELENLLQESNPTLKEWAAKELEAHRLEKLRLDRALGLWPQKTAEPQWIEKKGQVTAPIPTPAPHPT